MASPVSESPKEVPLLMLGLFTNRWQTGPPSFCTIYVPLFFLTAIFVDRLYIGYDRIILCHWEIDLKNIIRPQIYLMTWELNPDSFQWMVNFQSQRILWIVTAWTTVHTLPLSDVCQKDVAASSSSCHTGVSTTEVVSTGSILDWRLSRTRPNHVIVVKICPVNMDDISETPVVQCASLLC